MCQLLMSINPEHVENIFAGNKKYEFRKRASKKIPSKIIIYSTTPVKKVVGEVEVIGIIEDTPSTVWAKTCKLSGINKEFFDKYFDGRKLAVAYQLGMVKQYKTPKTLSQIGVNVAPQSYMYLD